MPLHESVTVDPVIVVAKSHIVRIFSETADQLLDRAKEAWEKGHASAPSGFDWMTNKHAQTCLGLSKATLARYRADGTLPYSRLGSSVFYRRADVEAVLAAGAVRVGRGAAGDGAAVPAVAPVLPP